MHTIQPAVRTQNGAIKAAHLDGGVLAPSGSPFYPSEGSRLDQTGTASGGSTATRTLAAKLYLKIRKTCESRDDALQTMASRDGAPELRVLRSWASADRWEDIYERDRMSGLLSAEELKADYRLMRLKTQLKYHSEVLDAAFNRIHGRLTEDEFVTESDLNVYHKAWNVWKSGLDALWEAEQAFRARVENNQTLAAAERKDILVQELLDEYGTKGPQYLHLVSLLAGVTVRMESIEVSGRAESSDEYVELAKLKLSTIGQLQKFTEASKSLALKDDVNKVAVELVRIAERIFGGYTREWSTYVTEVTRAIQEREAVA